MYWQGSVPAGYEAKFLNTHNITRLIKTMAIEGIKEVLDNIPKSARDDRLYRGLVLENNMKVLLISDPTTDKAAAAMDVHVGKCFSRYGSCYKSIEIYPDNTLYLLIEPLISHRKSIKIDISGVFVCRDVLWQFLDLLVLIIIIINKLF